ncbi:transducin/WD40 repeat-like superfamily protein [Tanacetum coccineum]
MASVKHLIREFTPCVINDHGYGLSFILAFVDMVSTVLRMSEMTGLHLSHQGLMDARCDDVPSCVALATKKELGIQTIDTYPYIMGERPTKERSESEYIAGESKRYRINDVKVLRTNDFKNSSVAAADGMSYHLPVTAFPACHPKGLKTRHAVVIVGVDTTHEDPHMHHCEVKSSYGEQWGVGGFSRVGFEVFEYVLVPIFGYCRPVPLLLAAGALLQ